MATVWFRQPDIPRLDEAVSYCLHDLKDKQGLPRYASIATPQEFVVITAPACRIRARMYPGQIIQSSRLQEDSTDRSREQSFTPDADPWALILGFWHHCM